MSSYETSRHEPSRLARWAIGCLPGLVQHGQLREIADPSPRTLVARHDAAEGTDVALERLAVPFEGKNGFGAAEAFVELRQAEGGHIAVRGLGAHAQRKALAPERVPDGSTDGGEHLEQGDATVARALLG